MRIIFGSEVEVEDDQNLARLEACSRLPADELRRKLSSTAGFEPEGDGHVMICPAVLIQLCASKGDAEWRRGFDKMIAIAGQHGYLDSKGWVRAHFTSN